MAKRHERSLARRMAVQVLYTSEITKDSLEELLESDIEVPDEGPLPAYAHRLLCGVAQHSQAIDQALAAASENWSVERMPLVDYAILRLAAYEMLYEDETPVSVCINEAVELAKSFGGQDDSARFANGILGQIARTHAGKVGTDMPGEDQQASSNEALVGEEGE